MVNQAWDKYLQQLNMTLTDEEKDTHFHGKPNKDIFEYLFKRSLSAEELENVVEEKESIYREICLKQSTDLAPGAIGFLDFLKNNTIPFTIATSSGIGNVKFYFQHFNLQKWFNKDKVVYDDGSFKGKPAPDIFLIAAGKINVPIDKCAIFEDSVSGLQAAASAKAQKVFYVKSTNAYFKDTDIKVITDFNQVERGYFS
jgi:HAD superfamily hydrolase (TIGR01509 family)